MKFIYKDQKSGEISSIRFIMTTNKNLKEFLEKAVELCQTNIDFLNGKQIENFKISDKYFDELQKLQELINSFSFVHKGLNG
jgi:hypothetical protein